MTGEGYNKDFGERGCFWPKKGSKVVFLAFWVILGVFSEKW